MNTERMNAVGLLYAAVLLLAAAPPPDAPPPDAPVADAAMRGDVEQVRSLLRSGADVNAAQGDGMTALHWAAQNGNAELAEVLIYAGADVHAGTRIGHYTPLHVASRAGEAALIERLLEAGSDPNAKTTNSGATPLHLAAASGVPEAVAALVDHGADVNAREAAWGQTPLIFAAASNRAAAITALLEAGADPSVAAWAVDVPERAAVDEAAAEHWDEVMAAFREEADGDEEWQPTPRQIRMASRAAREIQRTGIVDDGCEGPGERAVDGTAGSAGAADEDCEEEEPGHHDYEQLVGSWGGLTPLLHAARQGHSEAAEALLDGGAEIDRVSAGDETSPLLMAAINGQFDLAMRLIERGADPNLASDAGATPLYAVIERRWAPRSRYPQPNDYTRQRTTYLEVLEALLQAGADPNARITRHLWYMTYSACGSHNCGLEHTVGATPFWRAAYATDVEAMRLLVAYGADPGIPTTKIPERRRYSQEEEKETDDPSGLPPVPAGGPAVYPIHAASGVGYGQGYAANAHRHAPAGWLPSVRYLVEELGADVNRRDHNGYNAVHHAAARGDRELILYLIEQGADVTAVSREGQTTADMANSPVQRVPPFPKAVELLESLGSENNDNCVTC